MTYLIVGRNELSNGLESTYSGEFLWACNHLKAERLLHLLLGKLLFGTFFLLLHLFPKVPWNCPMINRYLSFFTPFLIESEMLMDMQPT